MDMVIVLQLVSFPIGSWIARVITDKTKCLPIKPATVGEVPISRACFEIIGTVMLTPNRSCNYDNKL